MITAQPPAEVVGAGPFGRGYGSMFAPGRLTLGVYFPIRSFEGPEPAMVDQIELAQAVERVGFAALWARDVPLNDPTFGNLGQLYDPFVWLATIAARKSTIACDRRRDPPPPSSDRCRQGGGVARSPVRRTPRARSRIG